VHGVRAPHGKELLGIFEVILLPEEPQLLFHGVDCKKGTVNLEQGI
jgi:hypothetical protein